MELKKTAKYANQGRTVKLSVSAGLKTGKSTGIKTGRCTEWAQGCAAEGV